MQTVMIAAGTFISIILLGIALITIKKRFFSEEAVQRRRLRTFFSSRIKTPMDDAIYTGDFAKIATLSKRGMPIGKMVLWDLTSIRQPPHAIWASEPLFRLLIQCGADVNAQFQAGGKGIAGYETYETPLSNALRARRLDLVKLFLESGADPNAATDSKHPFRSRKLRVLDIVESGSTPFDQAATALLLQHGAKQERLGVYDGGTMYSYPE